MPRPISQANDVRKLFHSQNFLKNPAFVDSLINKTDINAGDLVVEIGPGKGIITNSLSKKACRVIGIEIDHHLVTSLKRKFQPNKNIEIIETDFLKWNLPQNLTKYFLISLLT